MLALLVSSIIAIPSARADDLLPPSYRGLPGSTYQGWSFGTSVTNPLPDSVSNPFGIPTLTIFESVNNTGIGWQNSLPVVYGTKQGFWDLGNDGYMTLSIPTSATITANEQVRLQVTYWQAIDVAPGLNIVPSGVQTVVTNILVESRPLGSWYEEVVDWSITPGTTNILLTIFGNPSNGSVIDQIVLDSVPEPSVIAFAGMGVGVLSVLVARKCRKGAAAEDSKTVDS